MLGLNFTIKKIITLIEPYLITLGIKYKKLSKQDIGNGYRKHPLFKKLEIKCKEVEW